MMTQYQRTQTSILAVEAVPSEEVGRYGIVSLAPNSDIITDIIEKPAPSDTDSSLAIAGRYILSPRIFELLACTEKGIRGEVQLTDAIVKLLQQEQVVAFMFRGRRYDCGSRKGFLEATLAYSLKRPELRLWLEHYLENMFNLNG